MDTNTDPVRALIEKWRDAAEFFRGDAGSDIRETLMACARELEAALAQQPASVGEEIMVNAGHDVFILPLQPSGLSSGPRFVVHVPGPEQPAAPVDVEAVLRLFLTGDGYIAECDIPHIVHALAAQQQEARND